MLPLNSLWRSAFFPGLIANALFLINSVASAATHTVTSTGDSGVGTLRQTITDAAVGDTIDFSLPPQSTIGLLSGPVVIDKSLTISGPGADLLAVRNANSNIGNNRTPVISIPAGDFQIAISGLTVSGGMAGGIINSARTVTLTRVVVSGNSFHGSYGGGIVNAGTMSIIACTISQNSSPGGVASGGGGIANYGGTLTVTNSTISGNTAPSGDGGGILNQNQFSSGGSAPTATLTLLNCTIANNNSFIGGGFSNSDGATVRAENTIVALNTVNSNNSVSPDVHGALISQGNNFIGNDSGATITVAGGDQIGTAASPNDPMLGSLQDNGGPTETQALLSGSTAIDAGNDSSAPPRDQRGYLRNGQSDIGAFEFGGTIPVTLANISTRVEVAPDGSAQLIGGFIITGTQPKKVLLRGLGPSLPLNGKLADPALELHDSTKVIATNGNWRTNSNASDIEATGLAPTNDLEAAILVVLAPGTYTAIVSGTNDASSGGVHYAPGIGTIEVYDLDRTVNSKLANISSRGLVQAGDKVMIAGVIVLGADSQKVLVRALGPSVPVQDQRLLDPTLELRDGNGALLASNDNWRSDQQAEITATGVPPPNDAESALVRTLPPGLYTAIVRGVNETKGIALIEVYTLK